MSKVQDVLLEQSKGRKQMKTCTKCKKEKTGSHYSWCVSCNREYHRQYQKSHREYFAKQQKKWRKKNPEKRKKILGRWLLNRKSEYYNTLEYREYKRRIDREYTFKKRFGGLRDFILQRDNGTCSLCGMTREEHREKYGKDICVDHIDGNNIYSEKPNNSPENLRVLCFVCNLHAYRELKKLKAEGIR